MKRITFVFGCVFIFLLFGCGSSDLTTDHSTDAQEEQLMYHINLEECLDNPSSINLTEISDTMSYIELNTPRDMPIGVITNIKVSEEYIFISTKGEMYQFNMDGEYIRRIGGRGKGPGEYLGAFDFFIDEHKKILSVLDYNRLYSYSFDGEFIKSNPVGQLSGVFVKDTLIYASNEITGKEKYKMVVLNALLDTIAGIPNHNIFDLDYTIGTASSFRQPFYVFGDDFYFKGYEGNDTIWHIDGLIFKIHAVIDMGIYKYPEYKNIEDVEAWMSNYRQKKGDYNRVNIAMEDDYFIYLALEPYFNPVMGSPRVLFDKSQNKGMTAKTASGEDGFTDDILGGPAFWPVLISNSEYVSVVNSYDLIEKSRELPSPSDSYKEFLKSIDEDSNPVVIIAKKRK